MFDNYSCQFGKKFVKVSKNFLTATLKPWDAQPKSGLLNNINRHFDTSFVSNERHDIVQWHGIEPQTPLYLLIMIICNEACFPCRGEKLSKIVSYSRLLVGGNAAKTPTKCVDFLLHPSKFKANFSVSSAAIRFWTSFVTSPMYFSKLLTEIGSSFEYSRFFSSSTKGKCFKDDQIQLSQRKCSNSS